MLNSLAVKSYCATCVRKPWWHIRSWNCSHSPRRSSRRWIKCTWWFGTLSCPLSRSLLFCQTVGGLLSADVTAEEDVCRPAGSIPAVITAKEEVQTCQTSSPPLIQQEDSPLTAFSPVSAPYRVQCLLQPQYEQTTSWWFIY